MRDAAPWARLRAANSDWLSPWEATLPRGAVSGVTSYRDMVRTLRRRARQGYTMPFVVTYDGTMVGQLTVSGITWGSARWANIGYWIAEDHAGKAIIPTALALVCDHLFAIGLHRVEVAIRPENEASLRVVRKLGFTPVGLSPRFLHIAGDWRDHEIFQIVVEDVPAGVLARLIRR